MFFEQYSLMLFFEKVIKDVSSFYSLFTFAQLSDAPHVVFYAKMN